MRKFDAFMVGFASAFHGIGECLVLFCEAVCQPLDKPPAPKVENFLDALQKDWQKDRQALALDWYKIGADFRQAINTYVETHEGKTVANL
jgi:hypothetical protein